LKIHSIAMKNYRVYKGIQRIDFKIDNDKDVNIVLGTTGAGKTTLLDGINWCLYGFEPDYFEHKGGVAPSINRNILGEKYAKTEAYVEVTFGEKNPEYCFKRKITAWNSMKEEPSNKVMRHSIYPSDSISSDPTIVFMNRNLTVDVVFEAFRKTRSGWDLMEHPDLLVDRILPKDISFVFLFNGEKLNEFFEEHKNLEQALEDVSQITLTINTIKELTKVKKGYRKKALKDIPDIEKMDRELNIMEKALKEIEEKKKSASMKIEIIEKEIGKIDQYLRNTNVEIVTRNANERLTLKSQEKGLLETIGSGLSERDKLLVNITPWAYLMDEVSYSLKKIQEIGKNVGLPPNIKDVFLNDLLKKGECICKRSIEECQDHDISKARKYVKELLNNMTTPSRITEQSNEGRYNLDSMKILIKEKKDIVDKISEEIRINQDTLKHNDLRLERISKELLKFEKEGITPDTVSLKVKSFESNRRQYDIDKGEINKDIGGYNAEIKSLKKSIEEKNNQIDKAIKNKSSDQETQKKTEFCTDSLNILEKIKGELMKEMKQNIEDGTTKHYLSLIWKYADIGGDVNKNIRKVQINEDFSISVITEHGENWVESLSKGETQTLAYSFIASLKESSKKELSMVIDTPLGRLAKKPRELFAQLITTFLNGTQFIFLMTDTEYTPAIQGILDPDTSSKHILSHNTEDKTTKVEILN